jgi:hypothetical protein
MTKESHERSFYTIIKFNGCFCEKGKIII